MNMISTLRQRVRAGGSATITIDEFNQLQSEWITRANIETPSVETENGVMWGALNDIAFNPDRVDPAGYAKSVLVSLGGS